jgi:hypothetical protein
MADDGKSDKARAEIKRLQAEDGKKAMLDYEAQATALRLKTEKLRAQRLAREAAMPPAPAKKSSKSGASKSTKSAKAKKVKGQPLSDWLDGQEKDGHRD